MKRNRTFSIFFTIYSTILFGMVIPHFSSSARAQAEMDFSLHFDDRNFEFITPFEDRMARTVEVRNNSGSRQELEFFVEITGPNGFQKEGGELGIAPSPQPNYLFLEPGERQFIHIMIAWGDLVEAWGGSVDVPPGKHEIKMKVAVFPRGQYNRAKTVILYNTINSLLPEEVNPNASISGRVKAKETGVAISSAQVEILGPGCMPACGPQKVRPDGGFEMRVFTSRRAISGKFAEFNLRVTAPGYETFNKAVVPKPGENTAMDIILSPFEGRAYYKKVGEFEAPLFTPPTFSKNQQNLILYPFHNPLEFSKDFIRDNAFLYYFDIESETPLWKYRIYNETPAGDISADGELVAIGVSGTPEIKVPIEKGIHILNKKGELLWVFSPEEAIDFRHVTFSDDKKYMAAGDADGNIFFVNLETRQTLWKKFLGGQIRVIRFEESGSKLIVSSGDGYLYAFDVSGRKLWRTYVTSWLLGFDSSKNYFLASPKAGFWLYLLDKSGNVLWQYPVEERSDAVFISPDESYMLYTTLISPLGMAFFTPQGELKFFLEPAGGAQITRGGELIFRSTQEGRISLINANGHELWSQKVKAGGGSAIMANKDATRFVVLVDNKLYFFEGSVEGVAAQQNSQDSKTDDNKQAAGYPTQIKIILAGAIISALAIIITLALRKKISAKLR